MIYLRGDEMMSELLNRIKLERNKARGELTGRVKADILTLVLGEVDTLSKRTGKAPTCESVTAIIKKLIKSNTVTLGLVGPERGRLEALQNITLYELIPVECTEDEVYELLTGAPFSTIGEAMSFMEREHKGKYDKRMASKVAKRLLG